MINDFAVPFSLIGSYLAYKPIVMPAKGSLISVFMQGKKGGMIFA
jgi:hypothetical protein